MIVTTEDLIKQLKKYPLDTKISIWQDDVNINKEKITLTYCPETKEVILY